MSRNPKQTLFVLFFAFVVSALIFGLLPTLIMANPGPTRPPDPTAARPIIYGLAAFSILGAVATALLKMRTAASRAQFQTMMILSLALAQSCCIFGLLLFLLGGPAGEFMRFQIATIAVDVVFVLPLIFARMT